MIPRETFTFYETVTGGWCVCRGAPKTREQGRGPFQTRVMAEGWVLTQELEGEREERYR